MFSKSKVQYTLIEQSSKQYFGQIFISVNSSLARDYFLVMDKKISPLKVSSYLQNNNFGFKIYTLVLVKPLLPTSYYSIHTYALNKNPVYL